MHNQTAVVREALGPTFEQVPVLGALCFVDGDWGFRRRPYRVSSVVITWPKALRRALVQEGALDVVGRAAHLEAHLSPASS